MTNEFDYYTEIEELKAQIELLENSNRALTIMSQDNLKEIQGIIELIDSGIDNTYKTIKNPNGSINYTFNLGWLEAFNYIRDYMELELNIKKPK